MSELGIIMQPESVRAIIAGTKTVTRRLGKRWAKVAPGDMLWVRETHCIVDDTEFGGERWVDYRATPKYSAEHPAGWENAPKDHEALKWRPSIFMPKSTCRLWLEVVSTRWERLQDITEEDAEREGVAPWVYGHGPINVELE